MTTSINIHLGDCMEAIQKMKDKQFDLAIVDPPYGLDSRLCNGAGKLRDRNFKNLYIGKSWDKKPDSKYFRELFRVSKNHIICGGNYFELPPTRGIVAWDKCQPWPNFSAFELIWTSFDVPAKLVKIDNRNMQGKEHPTQKPVALYKWLLTNYAKKGDTILDTHGGSMSIAIACHDLGFDLDLWELDEDYYKAGKERYERHASQQTFEFPEIEEEKPTQQIFFE